MKALLTAFLLAIFTTGAQAVDITALLAKAKETTKKKPSPHELMAPYWCAEPGWHTEFQLRNNLLTSDLTVTPVLRLSTGQEFKLSPVTIPAATVTTVDVMTELNKVAPQLVHQTGTYGSVSFQYSSISTANLYAVAMVHMDGQPIGYHIDAASIGKKSVGGSREGIWWLPRQGVYDYLVISNGSDKAITGTLSIYDAAGKETKSTVKLGTHQTVRVVVSQLVSSANLTGSYGGIRFSVPNSAREINSVHFLYDPNAGFSAMMKMFHFDGTSKLEERMWAGNTKWTQWAPMLALKNPDPIVGFPQGTVLQPMVFLRNTITQSVNVNVSIGWHGDSGQGKANVPVITLQPLETRKLDIGSMQQQLGIPNTAHWGLVTVTTGVTPDDVIAVAASYDATGRYGAQTPFSDQLADHWTGGLWQVDSTHNSIIAVTNGGNQPTDALLTFFYNGGKDKYEIQKTIAPGDQLWLNLADYIHNSTPDKNGKVFPTTLTSGTYELRDLKPDKTLSGSLFEGKIIVDKTWGHLTYGCMTCCGYGSLRIMDPNPLVLPITTNGFTTPVVQDNCSGAQFDYNFITAWVSGNPNIIWVDPPGGMQTGLGGGAAGVGGSGDLDSGDGVDPGFTGGHPNACPRQVQDSGGTTNVLAITSISPAFGAIGTTVPVTITGSGFSAGALTVSAGDGIVVSIDPKNISDGQISVLFIIDSSTTSGSRDVSVTVAGQKSNTVTFQVVCAVPTNFSTVSEVNLPEGSLSFQYTFSSSTGITNDIAACTVGETVFYPGSSGIFVWPLPMVSQTQNPFVRSSNATNVFIPDRNFPPTSYQQPYMSAHFSSTQRFWFICPCYQNGALTNFVPDLTIDRRVFQDSDNLWKYQIDKSGYTNIVTLPNQ